MLVVSSSHLDPRRTFGLTTQISYRHAGKRRTGKVTWPIDRTNAAFSSFSAARPRRQLPLIYINVQFRDFSESAPLLKTSQSNIRARFRKRSVQKFDLLGAGAHHRCKRNIFRNSIEWMDMINRFQCCRNVLRNPSGVAILIATLSVAVVYGDAAPARTLGQTSKMQPIGGLSITIEGIREHLTAGTSFDVTAVLNNNTKSVVYVNEEYLRLKLPGEVEGRGTSATSFWYGFLPAANHGQKGQEKWNQSSLGLEPNHPTPVMWWVDLRNLASNPPPEGTGQTLRGALTYLYEQLSIELRFLLFVPGNYRLGIIASYWANADLSGIPSIAFESKMVDVAAPQSVILLGAAIGGLIAYIILPQARRRLSVSTGWYRYFLAVTGPFGAMLLSAMSAILLARISETQFLIRVTVSDLWGAIAIGFIANYLGAEFINKIVKVPETSSLQRSKHEKPTSDSKNQKAVAH